MISVVIPSWNGRELLDVVLPSVSAQTVGDVQVVVVDNGSSDGSVEHLRSRWPDVDVVALESNAGFAAAVNRGIERARGEYVALINNDVELDPAFLERLEAALEERPAFGSAAAKMLGYADRGLIDAAGDTLRWSGVALQRGKGERDSGQYEVVEPVFTACAGAALYRRAALDVVGPFDEDFFAYIEDVDWGFRAQLAGWPCVYVPGAVAFHMGSATSGQRETKVDPFWLGLPRRNAIWMVLKNYPASALLLYSRLLVADQVLALGVAARDGMLRAHLAALWAAARGLPRVLRQRRAIQRARVVDRRYLETVVTHGPPPGRRGLASLRRGR